MSPDERALMHDQERHDEQMGGECFLCGGSGSEVYTVGGNFYSTVCPGCAGTGWTE